MRNMFASLLLGTLLATSATAVFAQDEQPAAQLYDHSGSWVYASFFKVPWSNLDSLLKLTKILPEVREAAREIGCQQDLRLLVHNIGTEYNVVWMHHFKTLEDVRQGSFPHSFQCLNRSVTAVIPDSAQRAQWWEGYGRVFAPGSEHRDIVYWEAYPE